MRKYVLLLALLTTSCNACEGDECVEGCEITCSFDYYTSTEISRCMDYCVAERCVYAVTAGPRPDGGFRDASQPDGSDEYDSEVPDAGTEPDVGHYEDASVPDRGVWPDAEPVDAGFDPCTEACIGGDEFFEELCPSRDLECCQQWCHS